MALSLFHFSIPNPPKPRLRLRSSAADHPPSSLSPFDLRGYWSSIIADVEAELDTAIPLRDPRRIHEAMRHVVLAGAAKRAPSVMCVAACELAGGGRRLALPAAVALEMVHAAALAHDDLPCMDSAPLRRGLPSAHSLFGVDLALLAGDALLPLAISHLLSQSQSVPPIALARVAAEIARAVGPTAMIAGQLLDFHDVPADAFAILELKFGEMAECAAACGGMIGGAGEAAVGRLRRYGRAVGVLYRLVDDITMAEEADGEVRSKASVVRAVGMDRALEIMEELQVKAKKELQGLGDEFGDRVLPLYSFVDYAVERGFVVESGERVIASRLKLQFSDSFACIRSVFPGMDW